MTAFWDFAFVVAVNPPASPAGSGPAESPTTSPYRPEDPVPVASSRTVTPSGAVHESVEVDLSLHSDTSQSPAAADTLGVTCSAVPESTECTAATLPASTPR